MSDHRHTPQRGRSAVSNPDNRYAGHRREAVDDGWYPETPEPLRTELAVDTSRTIISRNRSPDVPFDRSINPYRGCEPIAMRGRLTPGSGCRRGWISSAGSSTSPTPPSN